MTNFGVSKKINNSCCVLKPKLWCILVRAKTPAASNDETAIYLTMSSDQ